MFKKADVIIILGGGINKDGTLKSPSLCRVKLAVKLYHQGLAQYLIPASKWSFQLDFTPLKTIAAAMKEELIKDGIPDSNILPEEASYDTIGNIYCCKKILIHNDWKHIIIVTSSFHQERARYLCEKILGPSYQLQYAMAENGLNSEELKIQMELEETLLNETKKYLDPLSDGNDPAIQKILENHPFYSASKEGFNFFNLSIRSPFHK